MTPAACGAVKPSLIVHALVSFSPVVKYVCSFSCAYAFRMRLFSPPSAAPRSARNSARSSSSSLMSSDSTCAETMVTPLPSLSACALTFFTCSLLAPASARSSSLTFAA